MIPIRFTRQMLKTEKMLVRLKMNDGRHFFDKESGLVTMTDEALAFYNSDSDFDLDLE